jgi:hypothetical protein
MRQHGGFFVSTIPLFYQAPQTFHRNRIMPPKEVQAEALKLPEGDREMLVHELLSSLSSQNSFMRRQGKWE